MSAPRKMICAVLLSCFLCSGAVAKAQRAADTAPNPTRATNPRGGEQRAAKHMERGLECATCHGNDEPKRRPTMPKCLECHESYEALAEKTKGKEPNPHKSHLGKPRCTECHKEHGESVLVCNGCHAFNVSKIP